MFSSDDEIEWKSSAYWYSVFRSFIKLKKVLPRMIIPHERLAPETLQTLIESFVSREGTDYGSTEMSFGGKVDQVRTQIIKQEALIVFDDRTESINIMPRQEVNIPWGLKA
ncbi:YheU family protein [Aurantivibrio infirmus]